MMYKSNERQLSSRQIVLASAGLILLGLLASQIPFTQLVGSKLRFTLFDFIAPMLGTVVGLIPGIVVVAVVGLINLVMHGLNTIDTFSVIRTITPLIACFYFAQSGTFNRIIPAVAILAFIVHPVGRTVWYFSLFWLIPIACSFVHERSLVARALGATFTQHALGGALWIYAFPSTASYWNGLIPLVVQERLMFTFGIVTMAMIANEVLAISRAKVMPRQPNAVPSSL